MIDRGIEVDNSLTENETRLSPMTRLNMTFDAELNLDKNGVLGHETYEKYIERHREALQKQDQLIRSVCSLNALLFLVLNGQNWTLPVLGILISDIPAVQEILLFGASMSFYFLCAAFVTSQCYSGIIDQYGNRIVDSNLIDPDFFNASRKHYEFFLKVYRPKMNIWGEDFYQHKWGFSVFSWLMNTIMIAVVMLLPITHLVLVGTGGWYVYASDLNIYAKWFLLIATTIINLGGLLMVFGMSKEFTFKVIQPVEPMPSQEDPGSPPDV